MSKLDCVRLEMSDKNINVHYASRNIEAYIGSGKR